MQPFVREARSGAVGGLWVDLLVGMDDGLSSLGLANADPEVVDKFLQGSDLGLCRKVTVEITNQADSERDVVQVIARHMTSIELGGPTMPDLDLPIA